MDEKKNMMEERRREKHYFSVHIRTLMHTRAHMHTHTCTHTHMYTHTPAAPIRENALTNPIAVIRTTVGKASGVYV